jgi:hypothetical protein
LTDVERENFNPKRHYEPAWKKAEQEELSVARG